LKTLSLRSAKTYDVYEAESVGTAEAGRASTMLALAAVGITRATVSPARASNDSYSRAVRSAPPVNVIIIMSALPKPGAS
jgi:hypothetical protein